MKDSWKRFLCALALVPCVGIMTACDSKDTDDTTPSTGEETPAPESGTQALTEEQMYQKSASIAKKVESGEQKVFAVNNTASEVMYMGDYSQISESGERTAIDASNPLKAKLDEKLLEGMSEMLGGRFVNNNVGYDLNTGQMYNQKFMKAVPGVDKGVFLSLEAMKEAGALDADDLYESTFIVKHGDKHVKYAHETSNDTKENVSPEHFLKSSDSNDGLKGVLADNFGIDAFTQNDTYEKFKNEIKQSILEMEEMIGESLSFDQFNINFEIKEIGENYVINAVASTKQPIVKDLGAGMSVEYSLNMTQQIAFTDEKLLSNSGVITMTSDQISELPLGEGGANITVSTPVIMQMETMSTYETVISAENQELIDSENYDATGAVNAIGSVNMHIDGVSIGSQSSELNNSFELADTWLVEESNHATFTGWFMDEACTIPYTTEAIPKFTSYSINLYTKTLELKEGHVRTKVVFYYNGYEGGSQVHFQTAGQYDLNEMLANVHYDIDKVLLDGVEIDISEPITAESKGDYVLTVYYVDKAGI